MPWLATAKETEPGHPLYVPPRQIAGRVDNADLYRVLYVADSATAAIAEAFGSLELWTVGMFGELPVLPGSTRALAEYTMPEGLVVLDLNDAQALLDWKLKPSEVVTRNRTVTQAWARRLFAAGLFAGVGWWSYYNPDWAAFGLWDYSRLTVADVVKLEAESPIVEEARRTLMRSWMR